MTTKALLWEKAADAEIDESANYLVADNGHEWRDFDLSVMRGIMVKSRLRPSYVRGRPEWIAKIVRPNSPTEIVMTEQPAKQPAILASEIAAVDGFLADGQQDNGYRAFAMMRHMWPRLRELALTSVAEDLNKSPGSAPDCVLPGHDETVSNLEALTVRGRQ